MSKLSKALLFVMLLSSVSLYGNTIFKSADSFHHVLDKAKSSGKLLLSYAASTAAPCCIAMENVTFNNQKVQNLLNTNFYPVKIDLSSDIGQVWADNFQIVSAPTLLFFDNDGTLIQQVENCISSAELTVILEEVLYFKENGFWRLEKDLPVVLTTTVPGESTTTGPSANPLNDQNPTTTTVSAPSIRILLEQVPTNDPAVESSVKRAKLKFSEYPITVKLVETDQHSSYQIWIGEFTECRKAQLLLETLKEQGFEKAELTCPPE